MWVPGSRWPAKSIDGPSDEQRLVSINSYSAAFADRGSQWGMQPANNVIIGAHDMLTLVYCLGFCKTVSLHIGLHIPLSVDQSTMPFVSLSILEALGC